jgi:hypothetical protein
MKDARFIASTQFILYMIFGLKQIHTNTNTKSRKPGSVDP